MSAKKPLTLDDLKREAPVFAKVLSAAAIPEPYGVDNGKKTCAE